MQRRDLIVKGLAALIKAPGLVAQNFFNILSFKPCFRIQLLRHFQYVQRTAAIAICRCGNELQCLIIRLTSGFLQRLTEQVYQLAVAQRPQHINLRTGEQGIIQFE